MNEPAAKANPEQFADMRRLRGDFPALSQSINGYPLVYLDSAASSQIPESVIDEIRRYQRNSHANVHRGVHTLSHRATEVYEDARKSVASFVNAKSVREIVFTSGTTASINLVAQTLARKVLRPGKKIVVTHLEHHSNIVPWQLVCDETGGELVVAPIDEVGQVDDQNICDLLDEDVVLVAMALVSNALGTVLPVENVAARAGELDIPILLDAAQAVPHMAVDVQALGCDFLAFSGHKMFGPTGIGVLYGKERFLENMPPWQGGGDMILEVSFAGTTYNDLPYKFEAGTPNISGAAGLGAAVRYLQQVGMNNVAAYESSLLGYLTESLREIDGVRLFGTAADKASVQSFLVDDIHPHDLGTLLDHQGIAIRTGHHCAMPVMEFYGVSGTARASLALYNNHDDVDRLVAGIKTARKIFSK